MHRIIITFLLFVTNLSFASNFELQLTGEDSIALMDIISGFNESAVVNDPEHSNVRLKKTWLQIGQGALSIACVLTMSQEASSFGLKQVDFALCRVQFQPQASNHDIDIMVLPKNLIVAKIFNPDIVTRLNKNLNGQTFNSSIPLGTDLGLHSNGMPSLKIECEQELIQAVSTKYCTLVAITSTLGP